MPYKDPERKRQWEREHREQRNARRKTQRLHARVTPIPPKSPPDPISALESLRVEAEKAGRKHGLGGPPDRPPTPIQDQERKSGWEALLSFAVWLAVMLLAAIAGASAPKSPTPQR